MILRSPELVEACLQRVSQATILAQTDEEANREFHAVLELHNPARDRIATLLQQIP